MKTRREFLKTLLSGTAVLVTAVLVPVSLLVRPKPKVEDLDLIPHFKWVGEEYGADPLTFTVDRKKFVTSGYAHHGDLEPIVANVTTTYSGSSGIRLRGQDGLTRYHWTIGDPDAT